MSYVNNMFVCISTFQEDLLAYIKESEQRQNSKLELLKRNQSCVKSRPDPEDLAKLDSSLKKNTAFVKKLVKLFCCN